MNLNKITQKASEQEKQREMKVLSEVTELENLPCPGSEDTSRCSELALLEELWGRVDAVITACLPHLTKSLLTPYQNLDSVEGSTAQGT